MSMSQKPIKILNLPNENNSKKIWLTKKKLTYIKNLQIQNYNSGIKGPHKLIKKTENE